MLFNSLQYALFLPIVFVLYWFIFDYAMAKWKHQLIAQNIFLLLASYTFYAWWDWRFLGLLVGMSIMSWIIGKYYAKAHAGGGIVHSHCLWFAIIIDLLVLGFFKYYNFFTTSFANVFGINPDSVTLRLVLPLGISFYTFQAISYVVDAYHNKLPQSTNNETASTWSNLVECLLYIGFFPKLLAGPIERPSNLIPQIQQRRTFTFELGADGLRQMLWGLFKKVVVADNCAIYVDQVYADFAHQSGSTLLLAAILYTIQIYGDFSGYSDMAIGSAKLLGFRFRDNFLFPYFSRNMGEFWKRWHISLNTWFVDYVYVPLGGSRNGKARTIVNTMIIFLLSGLWHGADWSFVAWGGYHGMLVVLLILMGWNTKYEHVVAHARWYPTFIEIGQMLSVFILATIGWMLFRVDNMSMFFDYGRNLLQPNLLSIPWLMTRDYYVPLIISICIMFIIEWFYRTRPDDILYATNKWVRWSLYYGVLLLCFYWSSMQKVQFVYFQF